MHTLCCPLPLFRRLLRLLATAPERRAWLRVGVCRRGLECIWLARSVASEEEAALHGRAPLFEVVLHGRPFERTRRPEPPPPASARGRLVFDLDAARAFVTGLVRVEGDVEPLVRVTVPGSGMREIWSLHPSARLVTPSRSSTRGSRHELRRWLRTIGALGGEAVYRRLVAAPAGVVGCGRLGALVATSLALLGVDVTLIDADRVEPHNLGEMVGVSDRNVGQPKVLAVSGHLSDALALPGTVTPITRAITDPEAVAAAKACAVLFCCADNDAARLATGLIATFHHKVLVDVGTGVFVAHPEAISAFEEQPRLGEEVQIVEAGTYRRLMGADVRLILPGDGCLRCRGSLADYDGALRELSSTPPGHRRAVRTRAGSLFTLNALAASIAVQMYQDLVAERLFDTTWAHLRVDDRGRLSVDYPPMSALPLEECPLCARAGTGDRGV